MSKTAKIMRDILWIDNKTIHNPAGLQIINKDGRLFVSGNELNEILKNYNYKIFELIVLTELNKLLFKKGKMYDLLVDIKTLEAAIVKNDL